MPFRQGDLRHGEPEHARESLLELWIGKRIHDAYP